MIKNKFLLAFFLVLLFVFQIYAQADWVRWEKVNNYLIENSNCENKWDEPSDLHNEKIFNFADLFLRFYKISISDFDGDNCRFHPSCSEFFVESTKINSLFTSALLFFDRLTRDTNILSNGSYKIINNKFYDPPSDYLYYKKESNQ